MEKQPNKFKSIHEIERDKAQIKIDLCKQLHKLSPKVNKSTQKISTIYALIEH